MGMLGGQGGGNPPKKNKGWADKASWALFAELGN